MSQRKLLLADDSVTIQKVVNLTFADEGVDVIAVGDGDTAIEKIAEVSPDVVLADVHMPGLNGYQICEMLRGNPATKDLPVVLLVGSFEPFDESEAERVGANAYLTKPFQSIRQLVAKVSDLMEAAGRRDGDAERSDAAGDRTPEETRSEQPRETTDIDSLYHQSFSGPETASAPAAETEYVGEGTPSPHFVDAGMDDEMIETRPVEDEAVSARRPSEDETEEQTAVSARAEGAAAGASPFDSLATGEGTGSYRESGDSTSHFDQYSATEKFPAFEEAPTGSEFTLSEIDLLELPPIENGRTLEFTTTESLVAQGGNKQVISLSPELLEVIVQKVVEKLAERH